MHQIDLGLAINNSSANVGGNGMSVEEMTWDPLASGVEADQEIIASAQKRQIRNILKSYVGMYDSFSELIQNAMDALDRRRREINEPNYEPRLWLRINLSEQSFEIVDNGIGFGEKEFRAFLAPNISFKDGDVTRGSKGVGATYLGYGFNHLQFATKSPSFSFVGEIKGGREWVDDMKGIVTRPVASKCTSFSAAFDRIDRGSAFKIYFGGNNVRPKDLGYFGASQARQWLYLLLIKTPLGHVCFSDDNRSQIKFDLELIEKGGGESRITNQDAVYMFPHSQIKASVNLKEVLDLQKKLITAGKDASALPPKYSKLNGMYEFFGPDELKSLGIRSSGGKDRKEIDAVIDSYRVNAYGYFTYSTSVWDQLNDEVAGLRKGYRFLRGGLQLANNGMAQGELIMIPLTSNVGYQNQAHIVVHFQGADPDLGRKGFQPELKEAAEAISVAIVNKFKGWRARLLKSDSGAKPDIEKEVDLHDWIRSQEEHEKAHPLIIKNPNFFAPVHEISITSLPQSEQDVIVLFNQLLAGGVIRGLKLLATNQVKQYDSVFKFSVKEPLGDHTFDENLNPLGVEELHHQKPHVSAPKVLEYKYNLDALMREFESGEKNEREVQLAVVWHVGSDWRKKYQAVSLLDLDNIHQREFHGLTHLFDSGTHRFHVVVLSELIEYLNDVRGVQAWHQKNYGDDSLE